MMQLLTGLNFLLVTIFVEFLMASYLLRASMKNYLHRKRSIKPQVTQSAPVRAPVPVHTPVHTPVQAPVYIPTPSNRPKPDRSTQITRFDRPKPPCKPPREVIHEGILCIEVDDDDIIGIPTAEEIIASITGDIVTDDIEHTCVIMQMIEEELTIARPGRLAEPPIDTSYARFRRGRR